MPVGSFDVIATVGPRSLESPYALVAAGATALRLNAAHLLPAQARQLVAALRLTPPIPRIVIDLQGAKMRLAQGPDRLLTAGERVRLAPSSGQGSGALVVPHPELFVQACAGDTITLDDARVRLRVDEVAPDVLVARVLEGGPLSGRKGINVVEHPVDLSELAPTDRAVVAALAGLPGLEWALSFVRDARDFGRLRRALPGGLVSAKVERAEALADLGRLAEAADSLWICRGDLGAQVGAARLARFVGRCDPRSLPAPVLMAGQVLEHMTRHPHATRSEVCHLHDLWCRGYAGIVLSDETAIGDAPVRVVGYVRELLSDLAALEEAGPASS